MKRGYSESSSTSLGPPQSRFKLNPEDDVEIPPHREKYDVFISFRGEDTRLGITSHLHAALLHKKIETYIDYRLQRGEEIGPTLLEAIEKSTLSAIIFSKNYASSTWCLDELVHILKCKERYGQMVIPVFYDISPSDIRNQQGSYAVAFAGLEKRFKDSLDKVQEWRNALTTAANLSGFDYSSNPWTEADLIKNVVDDIWNKLIRESSCDLKGLVGIERRIEQIKSLLCIHSPDACITVGIWGMGGIGKTTIAENVYHKLSSTFEASCFLRNVREKSEQTDGLDRLEKELLKEILKKEDLSIGSTFVRKSLSRTKVLIVLDDVSDSMQMKHLAGNRLQYGTGSRIIITSRDRRTLRPTIEEDKIYEVGGLKLDDAFQLFCLHAFKNNSTPRTDYKGLVEKAVNYAGGIPLALVLLGSSFLNCESKEEWEDELNNLKEFPNENIHKVLRLSYDRLGRNEKEIFLDIACFHKGKRVDDVKNMLAIRGFHAARGIRVLVDMSLISIRSNWNTIGMHDLLQEMGSTIVLKQCIENPGQRSRLFKYEDVHRVLQNNMGTSNVQAILVKRSKIEEQTLKHADFKVMSNLMMLIVNNSEVFFTGKLTASLELPNSLRYLCWHQYPLKCLPSNFCPENLVELHMYESRVKKLWNEEQRLVNLKVLNLSFSHDLKEVPNLSGSLKIEHINLYFCRNLVKIPGYFQHLDKLTYLNLEYCSSLKYLPEMPENVEFLDLQESGIQELPESVWSHEKISHLDIRYCRDLKKLPSNRCKLKVSGCFDLNYYRSLEEFSELPRDTSELSFVGCNRLVSLPTDICKLKSLKKLNLYGCSKLENFPEILEPMEHLEYLNLRETAVQELHSSIEFLPALISIQLQDCKRLSSIPKSICNLKSLEELNLSWCSNLEYFPEILEPMEHLKSLNLSGTKVKELHSSIEFLPALKKIRLSFCTRLSSIPESICKLKSLGTLDLKGCSAFYEFPQILEPMEHLNFLSLKGTAVEKLPSSIGNLIGLETLDLDMCRNLIVVPRSIYGLTNLKTLRFRYCRELKELLSGSICLLSLKVLDLCGTRISEIPDGLVGLTSLQVLDLSRSMIKSIPASIKQASQLHRLRLIGCKQLQSLPELPVQCHLHAQGCTSLKTVSSSRTALTQGWDKYKYFGDRNFLNCRKLDHNARSNIMDEAQLLFMRNATKRRKEFRESRRSVVCPGKEIPKWFSFSYQSEGSSVHIKLPPDFFRTGLLGFVLSVVVSCVSNCDTWFEIRARCNVKSPGETHELFNSSFYAELNSRIFNDHVCLWDLGHLAFRSSVVARMRSPDIYKLANEASVEFHVEDLYWTDISSEKAKNCGVKVKKCGVWPLYAEDVEKFKLDHVFMSGEPKIQEETREDETWEASGTNYGSSNEAQPSQLIDGGGVLVEVESDGINSKASGSSYNQFELDESDDESDASGSSYKNKANESDDESEASEASYQSQLGYGKAISDDEFELDESDDESDASGSSL